jgi:molybdenum cofactor cytidylyltransferase
MKFRFGIVILAAGASSRMGRPKMLLPWGRTTVLGRLVEQWRELGAGQIGVVTADRDQPLAAELDRLGIGPAERISNPDPSRGMFSSIQCAARWNCWGEPLVQIGIALGDQPHLADERLRALIHFTRSYSENICQPGYQSRGRHPVFMPRKVFESLATTAASTLKEFLAIHASLVRRVEMNEPALDLDLDTPADYERASERFLDQRRERSSD